MEAAGLQDQSGTKALIFGWLFGAGEVSSTNAESERAGSGLPNIFRVWRDGDFVEQPTLFEEFQPERITLTLPLETVVSFLDPDDISFDNLTEQKRSIIVQVS